MAYSFPGPLFPLWLNPIVHVRAGFRAVIRQPALALGEIAWRWAFGAAAWILVVVAVRRILAQVEITQAELLIARHSNLFLIADACARIVIQVLPQLARESLVLVPAIAALWVAAATVGRAIIMNALLASDVLQRESARSGSRSMRFGPLLSLHALRAVLTLATVVAFFGAMFLAGMAMPAQKLTTGAVVGILLAALVAFSWSVVNWFLALAPVWIVRDGRPALPSIADSVDLFRRGSAQYAGIASWFGLLRATAFVAAFIFALIASQAKPATAIALCLVIALVYFAIADFLYVVRLAAFVALDESTLPPAMSIQPFTPEPLIPASPPPANSNG